MYVLIQAVILINLVIAMADAYERVQQDAPGIWRREQARAILEAEQVRHVPIV